MLSLPKHPARAARVVNPNEASEMLLKLSMTFFYNNCYPC